MSQGMVNRNARNAAVAAMVLVLGLAGPAMSEDIYWTGYQNGIMNPFPDVGSWFHGDNWLNYRAPGEGDNAVLGSDHVPSNGNTDNRPHHIYFGDFDLAGYGLPNDVFTPGGDAKVSSLQILDDSWILDFSYGRTIGGTLPTNPRDGSLTATSFIHVGGSNESSLTIQNGTLTTNYVVVSASQDSSATLAVNNAHLVAANTLFDVGVLGGKGQVTISNGSSVLAGYTRIGENLGSWGQFTVSGANTTFGAQGMQIGASGKGRFLVEDGALATSNGTCWLGNCGPGDGSAIVTGRDSAWNISGDLVAGDSYKGVLTIENGGSVSNGYAWIGGGADAIGQASVTGIGSTWTNSRSLTVGNWGTGNLTINGGGQVTSSDATLGSQIGSHGTVTVTGTASSWTIKDGWLSVAPGGTGRLDIRSQGVVTVAQGLVLGDQGTVDVTGGGRMQIGSGSLPTAADTILIGPGGILTGTGTILGHVLNYGGTVSPGHSPGILHLSDFSQDSDGTLVMQIAGAAPGTEYDVLDVAGDIHLEGTLNLFFPDGYVPSVGQTLNLFTCGGVVSGQFDAVTGLPSDWQSTFSIDNGVLAITLVPEPATLGLLGLGVLTFCRRRIRR